MPGRPDLDGQQQHNADVQKSGEDEARKWHLLLLFFTVTDSC